MKDGILRLIVDEPCAGAVNMAVDEAILQAVNDGGSEATLRFYRWAEPTISLGYFQKVEEFEAQSDDIKHMPMVRRQTGGGAILHDKELTYSLILPLEGCGVTDIEAVYKLVHDAYIAGLCGQGVAAVYRGGEDRGNSQRGPFFCFARGHRLDLVVGAAKIVGSAQRRVKKAVLQHGSLILGNDFGEHPCATAGAEFDVGRFVEEAAVTIGQGLKLEVRQGVLSEREKNGADELLVKYEGDEWNRQR